MGDRNSDNLTRRMNREGKGLFEIMLESERSPARSSAAPSYAQTPEPRQALNTQQRQASYTPEAKPQSFMEQITSAQQRVENLEQQSSDMAAAVHSTATQLEEARQLVAEQERQLQVLRKSARDQQKRLAQKQDDQHKHQLQLDTAHGKLQSLVRQQEQLSEQQQRPVQEQVQPHYQQHSYASEQMSPEQATAELSGRRKSNILSRHRETAVTPQARAVPLSGNYQPPAWCYQKLVQHEGIPQDYAQKQLEDFKMYWLSTGEARKAWDYRFVKHVIYQWRREQSEGRTNSPRSTEEKLTDRSWASGPLLDFDD